jgi:cation:H+ antiporter
MKYLLLLIGFLFLILSGRLLIACSVSLARRLKLSSFVIGLTVVAMGTSAPELLVSLTGALKGHADVAVYNVIGSNISNVLLVLALAAVMRPIPVKNRNLWLDGSAMVLFSLLIWLLMLDLRLTGFDGGLMLALLIAYIFVSIRWPGKEIAAEPGEAENPTGSIRSDRKKDITNRRTGDSFVRRWLKGAGNGGKREMRIAWAIPGVVGASVGLAAGAVLLVDNAVLIAREIGLSERVISATMIAVGTSIPELTTSVIAAVRRETDISIGNIMGSNVFNIGFVLGVTAMAKPMKVNPLVLDFDIFWMAGVAVLLPVMILLPRRAIISKWKGLAMLLLYLVYLYLILNQPLPR